MKNNSLENPKTLTVELKERSYEIIVGEELISNADKYIAPLLPINKVFIVTDESVAELHLAKLHNALDRKKITYNDFIIPSGEKSKSYNQLLALLDGMFEHRPERKITIIAFGGGVVGDLAGFAASILLRGVPFIQIPTTLLSQVDSSVGGKTGVNNRFGKNLVGSFYQPKLVLADSSALATLSKREFLAGYAEIVKYGIINDRGFFDWLVKNTDSIKERDSEIIQQAVLHSCEHKANIVSQDEKEGGMRALLNLGHTFGHALEAEMGYDGRLLHGEAVSIGMVMALEFSSTIGLSAHDDAKQLTDHLLAVGLPTHPTDIHPEWDSAELLNHMKQDKKVSNGTLVFVLAKGIGQSFIQKDVQEKQVKIFLDKFLHNNVRH